MKTNISLESFELFCMKTALNLAKKNKGKTGVNPAVGCVIFKNKKIISKGATQPIGSDHAEVVALKKAGKLSKNATLVVTLEPCCHFGKTPPCTQAIIKNGISKVIIATRDPNPIVSGNGIKELKKAGILVVENILEKEAIETNIDFFTFITKKRPYITLKAAISLDGKMATSSGDSKWISSSTSRKLVHKLRAESDGILIGMQTLRADNPTLNVRDIKGSNPHRFIISSGSTLPQNCNLIKTAKEIPTTIFIPKGKAPKNNNSAIEYCEIASKDKHLPIKKIIKEIYKRNIKSLLIEGGSNTFSQFINNKLIDELKIFVAPILVGNGPSFFDGSLVKTIKKAFPLTELYSKTIDTDILITGKVK